MTINLGGSVVNEDGSVTLTAPAGFASVKAVRLTNYTPSVLIINNINPREQGSQEYLLPLQQNIYQSKNTGRLAVLQDVALGTTLNVSGVLVEWSDNPPVDFPGKYPTTISNGGLSAPTVSVTQLPLINTGQTYTIAANPFRTRLQLINYCGSDVLWSSSDGGWNATPRIISGSYPRDIASGAAIYLRATVAGSYIEVIEESVTPVTLPS